MTTLPFLLIRGPPKSPAQLPARAGLRVHSVFPFIRSPRPSCAIWRLQAWLPSMWLWRNCKERETPSPN